jgi:ABC-type Fe3+-siderophore transport system permease subunit
MYFSLVLGLSLTLISWKRHGEVAVVGLLLLGVELELVGSSVTFLLLLMERKKTRKRRKRGEREEV